MKCQGGSVVQAVKNFRRGKCRWAMWVSISTKDWNKKWYLQRPFCWVLVDKVKSIPIRIGSQTTWEAVRKDYIENQEKTVSKDYELHGKLRPSNGMSLHSIIPRDGSNTKKDRSWEAGGSDPLPPPPHQSWKLLCKKAVPKLFINPFCSTKDV